MNLKTKILTESRSAVLGFHCFDCSILLLNRQYSCFKFENGMILIIYRKNILNGDDETTSSSENILFQDIL